MKLRKKEFEIFNISFLDIISCGFGAVVLLVLISKTTDQGTLSTTATVESLLGQVITLENQITVLAEEIDDQKRTNEQKISEKEAIVVEREKVDQTADALQTREKQVADDLAGLSLVQSTLQRVSITPDSTETTRDEEVGGIPVDSDYVVFIIDTSGSMQSIWGRVSREVINVLNIHPQVKGFQILNDQGKALVSGYSGRFIPDTPQRRKSIMNVFGKWQSASNSSPIEGISTALKRYAKSGQSTAIYVFGDDYTGSSYDRVIAEITRINKKQPDGSRLAKIHGIGFISKSTTDRFAILMRELTKRNGGTFIALPL